MGLVCEIRDPEKTYSGSRIQGTKRHRVRIRNTDQMPIPIEYLCHFLFSKCTDPVYSTWRISTFLAACCTAASTAEMYQPVEIS
jgi:hypothetical protein